MIEFNRARRHLAVGKERPGIRRIAHFAVGVEQREHALDVGQRLTNFAVEHAQVVKRHVKLDQEGIHQHDVAHRHAPGGHAVCRAPHHQTDASGNDERLAEVKPGERNLALDLRSFPLLQLLVVALAFPGLVVEILDRLEVDQAIDRAHVRRGIQLIHRAPQMRAPVADQHGENDISAQGDKRDEAEIPCVAIEQNAQHQRDFNERGQDGIQRVADERTDRARAAFDIAREPAGLPLQMKAQRERMQMLEYLQGNGAYRLLRHAGEENFAQLGKQRGGKTQRTVGREQADRYQQKSLFARQGKRIDDVFEHQRHRNVGKLGNQQTAQRKNHPRLPRPQIRQQGFNGLPIVTRARGGDRQCNGRGTHG